MSNAVEAYFSSLRDIYNSGAGVAETSYYAPLSALLNEVGHKLKPKVSAIINLRNTGAGIPDGGLFTAPQLRGLEPGIDPLSGQLPNRGAIEVKGTSDDAFQIAQGDQVARYVERYGLVLVTNLRDFVLVGRSADGSGVRELESIRLATSEGSFWGRVQQPRKYAEDAGEGLTEFLRRVLLHNAPLSDPKDVAWFLASYARTARLRLESRHELPALAQLRSQLEESLGLKFEGDKGDHFFRSTLVQTLFYGMFASWVLWARDKDRGEVIPWDRRFQWETASQTLHVPMVAELFYQFSNPGRLRDLQIDEVLEWAEEVLWRVDRQSFFARFQEEHAVQYFYEPFLEAFDPQLRKELGVWYTPDEVVKYMVARVDWALREELGIADGLADPSVVVLDPCCGTGAFLVEVLRKIDETLQAKGADALTRQDVKSAALQRVIGFEIMPAPFVVAHLQLGILLAELGVPLEDADERAAVYLTNALTGWGDGSVAPPKDKRVHPDQMHSTLLFPEFANERDAANRVKREEQILVVIGNPPYNGYAGIAEDEEADLVRPYKEGLSSIWGIKKFNLDDLFVRFFRLAERQIAERSGRGVVCLISNSAWVSEQSFVVMRERLFSRFSSIWIDNLNGDSRETGKKTPSGEPDPSVFSTRWNREGIQVGTSVGLMVRDSDDVRSALVRYREFWGANKRHELIESLDSQLPSYEDVSVDPRLRYSFKQREIDPDYLRWPALSELWGTPPSNGLLEKRRNSLISTQRDVLARRMTDYFDRDLAWGELSGRIKGLAQDAARYPAEETRQKVTAAEGFDSSRIVPYLFRPFDVRWAYYSAVRPLWNEPRPQLAAQAKAGSEFLLARARAPRRDDGFPFMYFVGLADDHSMHKDAYLIPLELQAARDADSLELLPSGAVRSENLSFAAAAYVDALGATGRALWLHVLAVGHSPTYCRENADGLADDWARAPLPAGLGDLVASSALGERIAEIYGGGACPALPLGSLSSIGSNSLDPRTDLAVTARWGVAGQSGITMPSSGRLVERQYTDEESRAMRDSLGGQSDAGALEMLMGDTCFDVYLNDVAYWRCVPANVWRYTIGGYQVIKKWLSYREKALLGRDLKPEEARYVTEMVRRIAALILMQPELDANYERVKADAYQWEEGLSDAQ